MITERVPDRADGDGIRHSVLHDGFFHAVFMPAISRGVSLVKDRRRGRGDSLSCVARWTLVGVTRLSSCSKLGVSDALYAT